MTDSTKPVPSSTDASQPFWEGCSLGVVRLRHCPACKLYYAPPRAICSCGNARMTWVDASGHGKVFSYTIVHRAPDPAFKADLPYVIAIVELDEGAKLLSNVVGCPPDKVSVGMPLEACCQEVAAGIGLPRFQPPGSIT